MAGASLQAEMKQAVEALRELEIEMQNNQRAQQQLMQQQHENDMVLKELELLDEENKVYKLIGPALVRQDVAEATSNVKKRLEFIGSELKRLNSKLVTLQEKAGRRQGQLGHMQEELARMQQGVAATG